MMAWHEGGDNWDLKIAEDTLVKRSAMIVRSPPAKTAY